MVDKMKMKNAQKERRWIPLPTSFMMAALLRDFRCFPTGGIPNFCVVALCMRKPNVLTIAGGLATMRNWCATTMPWRRTHGDAGPPDGPLLFG